MKLIVSKDEDRRRHRLMDVLTHVHNIYRRVYGAARDLLSDIDALEDHKGALRVHVAEFVTLPPEVERMFRRAWSGVGELEENVEIVPRAPAAPVGPACEHCGSTLDHDGEATLCMSCCEVDEICWECGDELGSNVGIPLLSDDERAPRYCETCGAAYCEAEAEAEADE
jgi:hypothetical protein